MQTAGDFENPHRTRTTADPPATETRPDVRLVSWPATTPGETIAEVDRLIGHLFSLTHCTRQRDGSGCASDALWIQFQARPTGWQALAVADRGSSLIGIFPEALIAHTKLQANDVRFKVALGRVAAHEIVHLVVHDRDHWGNSLMRSHLSREMLTDLQLLPLARPEETKRMSNR